MARRWARADLGLAAGRPAAVRKGKPRKLRQTSSSLASHSEPNVRWFAARALRVRAKVSLYIN